MSASNSSPEDSNIQPEGEYLHIALYLKAPIRSQWKDPLFLLKGTIQDLIDGAEPEDFFHGLEIEDGHQRSNPFHVL